MPCPHDVAGLWHACALLWVCGKKIYGEKLLQFIIFSRKKVQSYICNQLNIKNNKINKDNFEKNHKKNMWRNTVAIHSVLKNKLRS
jgi:hypothetical protein